MRQVLGRGSSLTLVVIFVGLRSSFQRVPTAAQSSPYSPLTTAETVLATVDPLVEKDTLVIDRRTGRHVLIWSRRQSTRAVDRLAHVHVEHGDLPAASAGGIARAANAPS